MKQQSEFSKNLLLLGPPGAGKGTQAQRLAKDFSNLIKIDTGSLIREAIKNETDLGIEAKEYVKEGKLIPDSLVIGLILSKLEEIKKQEKHFLLDGFPRNIVQAESLDNLLKDNDLNLDSVIAISLDDDKLVERITGRRNCTNKNCGAVYHSTFSPPKEKDICDLCGSALYQRDDDKKELVQARLSTYNKETAPLISFYQEKNLLNSIDGNQNMNKVYQDILSLLN
ncbi:MAG: adenylate kinase [Candidatus Caenarcaniphilales bacterium]|nr:adenylate kinase [Candidatus Caenarcaniphilales bacterium]